ncbi:hypothetical protein GCM10017044_17930 [Kordiimonas sediminis]|uniref:Uncharacterized protein n=1 Tax=Kordiimonas sediminis TaxID=1735581 RepID=A0A919AS59_9PROT|nr:hypothetical protein [Kordiimonas sediminis]GHF23775.1 hypothetical protein GCM10017044_17930 [Kordiimonas sediminis]
MILIIVRLILILVPIAAVIFWLRWRIKRKHSDAELSEDISDLRRILLISIALIFGAAMTLYFVDDGKGDPNMRYVPPYEKDGKIIPGHFVPIDEEPDNPTDTDGDTPKGQG